VDSLTWTGLTRLGGIQLVDDSLTWTALERAGFCAQVADDDSLTWTATSGDAGTVPFSFGKVSEDVVRA
jgi:hypothetical protein